MRATLLVIIFSLILAGCVAPAASLGPNATSSTQTVPSFDLNHTVPLFPHDGVPWHKLREGLGALNDTNATRIFEDNASFARFWYDYNSTPLIPPPPVDFPHERVAAITTGQLQGGCHALHVTGVTRVDGVVHVAYTQETRGKPPASQGPYPAIDVCEFGIEEPNAFVAFEGAGRVVFDRTWKVIDALPDDRVFVGLVAQGDHSPFSGEGARVVRGDERAAVRAAIPPDDMVQEGLADAPLVVITLGPRDNDCASVELDFAHPSRRDPEQGGILLNYTEVVPNDPRLCEAATREPYLVAFLDSDENVTFHKSTRENLVGSYGHPIDAGYRVIAQGNISPYIRHVSGFGDNFVVIADSIAWEENWTRAGGPTNETTPEVNFTQHRVVTFGFAPTNDCSWLALHNVTQSSTRGSLQLNIEVHGNGSPPCGARNPWFFVEIPHSGDVGFLSRTVPGP